MDKKKGEIPWDPNFGDTWDGDVTLEENLKHLKEFEEENDESDNK